MAETDQPGVVDLVDAGVPADQGLAGLGLLMQLAGHVFAALATFLFMVVLIVPGSPKLWLFVIFATSCTRSMLQLGGGKQLVFGPNREGGALGGIHRYIYFALAQSAVVAAILAVPLETGAAQAISVGIGLALWPATLRVMLGLPRFRRFRTELPITEDKGFEGASILMTVLGLAGSLTSAFVLWMLLELPGAELQRGPNVLVLLSVAMMLVRSLLHVHAGVAGLRSTSLDHSVELAQRYATFGVISSFCGAGALLLFAMASGMEVAGLAFVCGACWVLVAWPMLVRKFFADRQFSDLLAGGAAPVHRRAPDAGLTWLGWLLIALAAWTASTLVPSLMVPDGTHGVWAELSGAGTYSGWWSVGLVVMQGWAGFELVRMSPYSKMIATAYAAIAVAVTVFLQWPLLAQIRDFGSTSHASSRLMDSGVMLEIGPVALALIVPIATLVLVHRTIAPAARARFRERAPS